MVKKLFLAVFATVMTAGSAFAAHPLITDDTGTQGKGKFQLEMNSEFSNESEDGATEEVFEFSPVLSYGLTDNVDIVLGVPHQHIWLKEDGQKSTENGLSDISLELKWRFYEKEGLSLALKPGISLPTGDDEKGLGAGKAIYSAFFVASKEIDPWAFHLNLGYIRNENRANERKNLYHASVAAAVGVLKDLTFTANIGVERNADRNVNTHPAFVLGGLIYSLSENLDVDFGIKAGLNEPASDYAVLAGVAWRF
jgi:hypothetical protein